MGVPCFPPPKFPPAALTTQGYMFQEDVKHLGAWVKTWRLCVCVCVTIKSRVKEQE